MDFPRSHVPTISKILPTARRALQTVTCLTAQVLFRPSDRTSQLYIRMCRHRKGHGQLTSCHRHLSGSCTCGCHFLLHCCCLVIQFCERRHGPIFEVVQFERTITVLACHPLNVWHHGGLFGFGLGHHFFSLDCGSCGSLNLRGCSFL